MNLEHAKKLLGDAIQSDGSLQDEGITWTGSDITLRGGDWTAEYLEAVVWHIKLMTALLKHSAIQELGDKL